MTQQRSIAVVYGVRRVVDVRSVKTSFAEPAFRIRQHLGLRRCAGSKGGGAVDCDVTAGPRNRCIVAEYVDVNTEWAWRGMEQMACTYPSG